MNPRNATAATTPILIQREFIQFSNDIGNFKLPQQPTGPRQHKMFRPPPRQP